MQKLKNYEFLEKASLDLGAGGAKVIPASQVVVEDRVRLKCTVGCPSYGACLKCPPYVPAPEEFRKILEEYSFAMVIKHKPPVMPEEINGPENESPEAAKERTKKLMSQFMAFYTKTLTIMLELERTAFNNGYTFATAFVGGRCLLCEKCNVEKGVCLNPTMARIAAETVGVNMVKTAENAGMTVKFSLEEKVPGPMALLLID